MRVLRARSAARVCKSYTHLQTHSIHKQARTLCTHTHMHTHAHPAQAAPHGERAPPQLQYRSCKRLTQGRGPHALVSAVLDTAGARLAVAVRDGRVLLLVRPCLPSNAFLHAYKAHLTAGCCCCCCCCCVPATKRYVHPDSQG